MWNAYEISYILPILLASLTAVVLFNSYYSHHPQKDRNSVLLLILIFLFAGELAKQIFNLTSDPIIPQMFPFFICTSVLIWYSFVCFAKKNGILYRVGYNFSYVISFITTAMLITCPSTVCPVRADGNMFVSWFNTWSILFHVAQVFIFFFMCSWKQYQLQWKDLCWTVPIGFLYLCFLGSMAITFNANYSDMLFAPAPLNNFGVGFLVGTIW
jgi:hypothetical protein